MNILRTSLLAIPMMMSAICFAQSAATPPASASPTDKAAGNNLTGTQDPSPNAAASPANPPASASPQQKATGNNLVTQQADSAMSARPTFASLDTRKAGYLTEQDAAGNQWFKANFSKCDLDHDNKVTSDEFASCSK